MPDFDTRTRQEPVQPSILKMFVAASKQHMSAVASRLRTSARVQLRNKNIIRLSGIGGGILLLAVGAVVTIVWAVLRHPQTPADQLDQELQPDACIRGRTLTLPFWQYLRLRLRGMQGDQSLPPKD